VFATVACGGRTRLEPAEELDVRVACETVEDCLVDACEDASCQDGFCEMAPVDCDDGDPCSEDGCDPSSGCVHRPLTHDLDGDGHAAPRSGFSADDDDACGDDCDDSAAAAHPGALELCDGRDNDCNGVTDDGAIYTASSLDPIRLSSLDAERAGFGGFVGLESGFAMTLKERHASEATEWRTLLLGLDARGETRFSTVISRPNVPVDFGPLAWSGRELVTAWNDARADGYDIYAARFTPDGDKLGPDLRVSNDAKFSLNPSLVYDNSDFVVVWDDRRDERGGEGSRIYGQLISPDGELLGENLRLTEDEQGTEFPSIASGGGRLGLVHTVYQTVTALRFRTLEAGLEVSAFSDTFGENARNPSVDALGGGFAVLWETYYPSMPGNELWGALFDESANFRLEPRLLVSGGRFLRGHAALSFGDRLLVVWAEDTTGNYDLSWQFFDSDLSPLGPRAALTSNAEDSVSPSLAVSAEGTIGIAFEDFRDGSRQVYFSAIACESR
jgi:hypothetical protein